MSTYEVNQEVWIQGTVKEVDEADELNLKVELGSDSAWLNSRKTIILTKAPPQPKPPAPVRLFGRTIFDLANCVEIGKVTLNKRVGVESFYSIDIDILRDPRQGRLIYFNFNTKEEAEAGRALIQKEVLKAKGIDDADA